MCAHAGVSGRVSVNGQPLAAGTMQRLCGYVLQDDVLPGTSTVQEYLRQVVKTLSFHGLGCSGFRAWVFRKT